MTIWCAYAKPSHDDQNNSIQLCRKCIVVWWKTYLLLFMLFNSDYIS